MSEKDLQLKLKTARLFWLMGSSTLLRVRLSTTETAATHRIAELTDLDVLGVSVAPDFRLRYKAAECKSSRVGAKEIFWLRGVLDYFGADDGYLVVHYDDQRRPALRELGERLRLGILTASDFDTLLGYYGESESASDQILFDRTTIAAGDQLLASLDKRLSRLHDYALRVYWQQPLHRNLQLAVAYLNDARESLDPTQRSHLLLVAEVVYRYCIALFAACEAVVKRGAPNVAQLLPAHLHGGDRGLRDAQRRLEAIKEFQEQIEGGERLDVSGIFSALPPYYGDMLELVTRVIRRPEEPTRMLRQLQAASWGSLVARVPLREIAPDQDAITTKLINDVLRFLITASKIDGEFRERLTELCDPTSESEPPARTNSASNRATAKESTPPKPVARRATASDGDSSEAEHSAIRRASRSRKHAAEGQEALPVEEDEGRERP